MAFAETFKALSDPVRREILNLLKGGRLTAGEIAGQFDMTAATVSYHLSLLKKAGLIFESREKNYIYYSLNASVLEEVLLWLQDSERGRKKHEEQQEGNAADFNDWSFACCRCIAGAALYRAFAGDHGTDTLGLFSGTRKRLVIACRHCVRPAAVYFGTASRLLLRREP